MAISPHHPTALVPNPVHAFDFLFKVALERRGSWICRRELARVCWRGVLPMWLGWSECQCWIAQKSTAIVKTRPDQHRQGFTYLLPEGLCLLLREPGELAYLAASVDSAGALGSANLPPAALAI